MLFRSASNYNPRVIRQVLDARSAAYRRRRVDSPISQLRRTLASLDQALEAARRPGGQASSA